VALDHAAHHKHSGEAVRRREGDPRHRAAKMVELRTLGDALETMVADDLWPLPTYREMLFIK